MRPRLFLLLAPAACLLAGGCDRASTPSGQGNVAVASPDEVPGGAQGSAQGGTAAPVAGFDRSHKGQPAPGYAFTGTDGHAVSVGDFRGAPVLVNLWATWCGPCVKELPTLDRLAASGRIKVIALSQDNDPAKATAYLAASGLKALSGYTDARTQWLGAVTTTLPTTILYDAAGLEVWRVVGDIDWTGADATAAIGELG